MSFLLLSFCSPGFAGSHCVVPVEKCVLPLNDRYNILRNSSKVRGWKLSLCATLTFLDIRDDEQTDR